MKSKFISLFGIIAFVLFHSLSLQGQRPAKVVSIVKEEHKYDYYESLAQQWKKVIVKDSTDADAWLNFYYANRYARMFSQEYSSKNQPIFQEPEVILKNAERAIPGTFEYFFIKASEEGMFEPDADNSILKAYKLGPSNPLVFPLMLNYYELHGDHEGIKDICLKWFNSNDMSPALLNYNYNVLMSVTDHSIIITNGDNDTYPLWLLKEARGVKKSVTVLNIHLISSLPEYRERVFRELKIPSYTSAVNKDNQADNNEFGLILKHILMHSPQAVYIANTLDRDYYKDMNIENDLYLVGLAMVYKKAGIDNIALIRNNYENYFLLDYLTQPFTNDPSSKLMSYMNLGYEPMLLKLFEHYKLSGEKSKAERVEKLGIQVAKEAGLEEEYRSYFTTN